VTRGAPRRRGARLALVVAALAAIYVVVAILAGPRARVEPYRGTRPAPGAITAFAPAGAGPVEASGGAPAFLIPGTTDASRHHLGTISRARTGDTLVVLVYGDSRPGLRLMTTAWGLPAILEATPRDPRTWVWALAQIPVLLVQCVLPRFDLMRDLVAITWTQRPTGGAEHRVLRALERASGDADLVVHAGDLVEDGRRGVQWEDFARRVRDLRTRVPLLAAPGNHERLWSPLSRASWDAVMGPPARPERYWFAVDLPDTVARFVFLDSEVLADPTDHYPDDEQARRAEEQLVWADSALAAPARWRFVVLHHPLVTSGHHFADWKYDDSGPAELRRRARLLELCRRHRVTAVLAGHEHLYQRVYLRGRDGRGVWHVTSGGGGSPLYRLSESERRRALATPLPDGSKVEVSETRSIYHYCRLALVPRTGEVRLDVLEVGDRGTRFVESIDLGRAPPLP
jgi:hypothetical protein